MRSLVVTVLRTLGEASLRLPGDVEAIAVSPSGALIAYASGGPGGVIQVVDATTREVRATFPEAAAALAFADESTLWSAYARTHRWTIGKDDPDVSSSRGTPMAYSRAARRGAAAARSPDATDVIIFDPDGELVTTIRGPGDRATSLAFSPDGARLAVAYESSAVMFDLATEKRTALRVPRGETGIRVAFTGSGKVLVWEDQASGAEAGLPPTPPDPPLCSPVNPATSEEYGIPYSAGPRPRPRLEVAPRTRACGRRATSSATRGATRSAFSRGLPPFPRLARNVEGHGPDDGWRAAPRALLVGTHDDPGCPSIVRDDRIHEVRVEGSGGASALVVIDEASRGDGEEYDDEGPPSVEWNMELRRAGACRLEGAALRCDEPVVVRATRTPTVLGKGTAHSSVRFATEAHVDARGRVVTRETYDDVGSWE